MSFRERASENITKRFVVLNIAMKAGVLVISLVAVGILATILTRVGDQALAPSETSAVKEAVQPAQPAYSSGSRIYNFPSAGTPSNDGPRNNAAAAATKAGVQKNQSAEAEVRYVLAMMGLVGEGSAYRIVNQSDPSSSEAWKRWGIGIRPTNLAEFDLLSGATGAIVVRRGTKEKIDGMSVMLSAPGN